MLASLSVLSLFLNTFVPLWSLTTLVVAKSCSSLHSQKSELTRAFKAGWLCEEMWWSCSRPFLIFHFVVSWSIVKTLVCSVPSPWSLSFIYTSAPDRPVATICELYLCLVWRHTLILFPGSLVKISKKFVNFAQLSGHAQMIVIHSDQRCHALFIHNYRQFWRDVL